jgi:hypothetical protein
MQNAELYRRGIVLPLDEDAEECLRANDVDTTTNVRVLAIPSEEMVDSLWRLGLFREINSRCATLLDDYEEEVVEASSVGAILGAVDSVARHVDAREPEMLEFLEGIRDLVRKACALSRPLLFVL